MPCACFCPLGQLVHREFKKFRFKYCPQLNFMILNQNIEWHDLDSKIKKAFLRQEAKKDFLNVHHEFYKFTQFPVIDGDKPITPWWFSVNPICEEDSGLTGAKKLAERIGVKVNDYARVRGAVTTQWNGMTGIKQIKLTVQAYCF